MVETNLPNILSSFKTIKKLALSLSCMTLLTCSVHASKTLDDLANYVGSVVTQNITLPSTDLFHDMSKRVERRLRPEPSNFSDRALQKVSDIFEDVQNTIERKVERPIENWMAKHLK